MSAAYVEEADRRLSEGVGATAFVTRSPSFDAVIAALQSALGAEANPAPAEGISPSTEMVHAERVVRQLDRQVGMNVDFAAQLSLQKAQLSILAGISEVLTRSTHIEEILTELLARCLESTGYSMGAVYLADAGGRLHLKGQIGFAAVSGELASFFGQPELLVEAMHQDRPVHIPSPEAPAERTGELLHRAAASFLFVTALVHGDRRFGALVMAAAGEEPRTAASFVQSVAGHISQAIALGQTLDHLAASERQFRNIAETAAEGIIQADAQGRITYLNPAAERIFDSREGESVGIPFDQLLPSLQGQPGLRETDGLTRSGQRIPLEISSRTTTDRAGAPCMIHVLRDLTERKRHEAQLIHMSNYDPLTQLVSRRRFLEDLEHQITIGGQQGDRGALMLIDIDQFKYVNESLGYRAADLLLKTTARVLKQLIRRTDVLGRTEGNQFAILVPRSSDDEAQEFADEILKQIAQNSGWFDGQLIRTTVSIGLAMITEGESDSEGILHRAEVALLQAKEAGRNRCHVYIGGESQRRVRQHQGNWHRRLSNALLHGRFQLWLHPIINLKRMSTAAYEVLLRLTNEDGSISLPGEFLHVAERSALIRQIDQWVIQNSIRLIAESCRAGTGLELEVNLSAKSLSDPDLLAMIQEELNVSGIPPERLCFEITETAAITNMIEAKEFITALKLKGCRFALDDFGIGFSSFYYLKNLPVDVIKIDGNFIRDLPRNSMDQHLVRAIVTVARGFGMQTIAEYVTDDETLQLLKAYGVDHGQGFHLGRPVYHGDILLSPPGTRDAR